MRRVMAEPTICRARLLTRGFGNSEGDVVLVKEIDKSENIYYYDEFRRWCYTEKGTYEIITRKFDINEYIAKSM